MDLLRVAEKVSLDCKIIKLETALAVGFGAKNSIEINELEIGDEPAKHSSIALEHEQLARIVRPQITINVQLKAQMAIESDEGKFFSLLTFL